MDNEGYTLNPDEMGAALVAAVGDSALQWVQGTDGVTWYVATSYKLISICPAICGFVPVSKEEACQTNARQLKYDWTVMYIYEDSLLYGHHFRTAADAVKAVELELMLEELKK